MTYIIDHEGPRKFVVYEMDGRNRVAIEEFKTAHSAKKFVKFKGGNIEQADITPKKRKRKFEDVPVMVEHCGKNTVSLWKQTQSTNSRMKAIRTMCLMCVGGVTKEVRLCPSVDCPLHKFRLTG